MSYLDEFGLFTYDNSLKEWISSQNSKTITSSIYPWTKTVKAGAVSCYPVGGTELKPVVDFLFTEVPPASGDKGPENPSTITGVSSVKVTRCGKNLCPLVNVAVPNVSTAGVTILVDAVSGSISISGKATANSTISFTPALATNFLAYGTLRAGKTYTFSLKGNTPSTGFKLRLFVTTTSSPSWSSDKINVTTNNSSIYMLPDDIVMAWLRIDISQDTDFGTGCIFTVQVEEGETATEFEPYFENKYPLPLGNTFYGGSIDLATGLMTVTHTTVVVNGNTTYSASIGKTETATSYSLAFYPPVSRSKYQGTTDKACNLFSTDGSTNCVAFGNNSYNIRIILEKSLLGLADDLSFYELQPAFQSFFGEHPMTIVYRLETPYTVQLTPPQISSLAQTDKYTSRLNTVYTDAQAVQVGYVKSPIREEYELTQAIVAQGGNI